MSKTTNKAVKAAATPAENGAAVAEKIAFKVPEEFKKVKYSEWPQELKDQYTAYRKAGRGKLEEAREAKWSELFELIKNNEAALALAKEIHDGPGRAKANPAKELFGQDPEVGLTTAFAMDKLKLVKKCQDKGYSLDVKDNKIVLVALPAAAA